MEGITKGNIHSYNDFKMRIISREINPPKKNKVKVSIPFMNGDYDFSNLYGPTSYSERSITYLFDLFYEDKIEYHNKKIKLLEWLLSSNKEKLTDDLIPGFYFLAECDGDIVFNEYTNGCEISVTFVAYPFKISEAYEGNNLWDSFNFELDYLQDSSFEVNGTKSINMYNRSSTNITPVVICSGPMEITKNGIKYLFDTGTSKDYIFELGIGDNVMDVKGNGTVEFKFRSEVL